ncbi:hypothetical protein JXO59_13935 [candidate division KSB1 bacterium]|nr:hypothetical protein [candidate division KSB1 bacterium]
MRTFNTYISVLPILLLALLTSTVNVRGQAQEPREYQRWGRFGVGKLVTTQNNLNCIADGQMRWPAWAHLPAMEYPYNPEPGGRHINYSVGISFYVGGYCEDYGPSFRPDQSEAPPVSPRVEHGDRTYYRYYDGFHYESFPDFVAPEENASIPVSDDPATWPMNGGVRGFPDFYPTHDWYHDSRFPEYANVYQSGQASPIPILKDEKTGWPGAGADGSRVADQESFSVNFSINRELVEDPDIQDGKLMVYTTLRGLSFADDFYDDFLVWVWTVTNISSKPITKAYVGMMADFDFPWATYQGYSSYNKVDCYAYDPEYAMAYGWDGDGNVAGATYGDWFHPKPAKLTDESIVEKPALAGVLFLKTPNRVDGTGEVGITKFDAFCFHIKDHVYGIGSSIWEFYWNNIVNRTSDGEGPSDGYDPDDLDLDGIDDWTWQHPYPMGNEQVYETGYKSEFTLSAGPFTLEPGETDTLISVVVMGETRDALFKNARFARQLYESNWKPIRPPIAPVLRADVGSGTVKLIWDHRSENDSLNAADERQPFEGYKLYRSNDGGQTWGSLGITDENGTIVDYVPMGQWDLANGITGPSPELPTFQRGADSGLDDIIEIAGQDTTIIEIINGDTVFVGSFRVGEETGRRIFFDNNVIDGFTYKYAVVAYSAGDEVSRLMPVQNSKSHGSQIITVVPHTSAARSASELEKIRVVPNPYRVIADWEMSMDERMIKFTHLPQRCTIRIFNVAGELIQTLNHDERSPIDSEAIWNLRTFENREVAPGLYFYHLDSDLGEKMGKFVIIK